MLSGKLRKGDVMGNPVGWYVRVKTGVITDGVYDTVMYIVGCPHALKQRRR